MDSLDKQIKAYFEKESDKILKKDRLERVPSVDAFYRFICGKMEGDDLERMLGYLKDHPEAQDLVSSARADLLSNDSSAVKMPPSSWVEDAKNLFTGGSSVKCPHCGKSITPFKKPVQNQKMYNFLWITLSLLAFLSSFVFHRYFLQCLAVALFFGIKWIIDQRATKTQILIYKALKGEDPGVHSRHLHNHPTHL